MRPRKLPILLKAFSAGLFAGATTGLVGAVTAPGPGGLKLVGERDWLFCLESIPPIPRKPREGLRGIPGRRASEDARMRGLDEVDGLPSVERDSKRPSKSRRSS